VDDGTGIIEAKQWIDTDSNKDEMDVESKSKLVQDGYCRVWGRVKQFNNKRHVGAHIIRPITDYNEINYHLLEATAVHLFFTRGPPPTAQSAGQKVAGTNGAGAVQQEFDPQQEALLSGVTPLARRVFRTLVKSPQSNEGLHVQMIASQMGVSVSDAYKGGEQLLASGLIFTTSDDDTWAVMPMV